MSGEMSGEMSDDFKHRRNGDVYVVTDEEKQSFKTNGYVHLREVLSQIETDEIAKVYEQFLRREIAVTGRDFNDMTSGEFGTDASGYAIANVMCPRRYYPQWQDNIFERRAATIAEQLCGPGMQIDFDQLLAKQPGRHDAVFGYHQDQAYWIDTDDRRTATCWLAVDDSTIENGCMQFLAGSHRQAVRQHHPLHRDRTESHTLVTELRDGDVMTLVPISRGDITVHNEGVLHGSGGNYSTGSWRRAYIVAFRTDETISAERALGFTHSHNDNIEVLDAVDGLHAKPSAGAQASGETIN